MLDNDAPTVETEESQRINKIWEGLRDEPSYSFDGLTNPLYRRQPKPPERRRVELCQRHCCNRSRSND